MSGLVLLAHGDDGYLIDQAVAAFVDRVGASDRVLLAPDRSPDEAILERAALEAASVGLFGAHCVVLRQPLRAAGTSGSAADRLIALVEQLPDGAALALAELRPSRDVGRPPALLKRLESAVRSVGGHVEPCLAPRRDELRGWVTRHATDLGIAIRPAAAAALAERIGGVWENDVERSEQTRVADGELRKLALAADGSPIEVSDVEALVSDTRPPSVNAVANAVERRDAARAAEALRRALDEGEPVLRIMAALEGRLVDLTVAHDLLTRGASPADITKRLRPGNPSGAERVANAARRYSGTELEGMLRGLFEADLAIKSNTAEPEAAITAWLGEYVLGAARAGRGQPVGEVSGSRRG
jgi:DNA polymerase III delta subunit